MLGAKRRENERERTLLALLREQQAMIRELNDRLADAHNRPWTLPPRPAPKEIDPEEAKRIRFERSLVEL